MTQTDAELVRQVLRDRREQTAYRALVERHSRAVYNLAYRMLGNPSDAEDVAQVTFLKAFQRLDTFQIDRRFPPWLLRIAHNTAVDLLRRARPDSRDIDEVDVVSTDGSGPAEALEQSELKRRLEHGLRQLRPTYRAALVLRYQEGLGYSELSTVMGVPEGTAKTYVHRARRELADVLRGHGLASAETAGPKPP